MRNIVIASLLFLSLPATAFAGPPDGAYSLEVGGANEIWYPAGDDMLCDTRGADSICLVTTGAATDGLGNVSSTGELQLDFPGTVVGSLPMTVVGKLSGSTAKPTPKVEIDASGTVTFTGLGTVQMTATGKFTCRDPLPHASEFECKGRARLCAMAVGRHSCTSGGLHMLLGAAGGSWILAMSLATDADGLVTGDATATLTNASVESFSVTGKYNAKRDRSTLKLVSTTLESKNKAAFANLLTDAGIIVSGKLAFVIAGEKGTENVLPAP
ncbi:MAG TPA: hypothetical protein VKF60_18150 [Myxococcota bacterium]|nr:hypothetical protein [Myxococcota bacterium]